MSEAYMGGAGGEKPNGYANNHSDWGTVNGGWTWGNNQDIYLTSSYTTLASVTISGTVKNVVAGFTPKSTSSYGPFAFVTEVNKEVTCPTHYAYGTTITYRIRVLGTTVYFEAKVATGTYTLSGLKFLAVQTN